MLSRYTGSIALLLLILGCGGPDKPAQQPEAELPPPAEEPPLPVEDTHAGTPAAAPETAEAAPAAGESGTAAAGGAQETRTTDVIAQIIKDNRKPFRDCYEQGKKKIPELEGTLTLFFVLGPKGDVKKAELNRERSDIVEPVVVDCSLAALRAIKFPPSSRGMESTVNYPFDFKR